MEPITFRAPPDLLDELAEEADTLGYSSRSEYMRHLLRNRGDTAPVSPNRTDTGSVSDHTGSRRVRERLDELEREVAKMKADSTPTAQNGSDSPSVDSSTDRMDTPHQPAPMDGFGGVALGEYRERVAVDDELREEMETALENIEVPGRKSRVGYTRREAVKFAWDLLREAGEAQSSWLANSTFGEFFEEPDLKYSTSSRYPGYGMWDGCVRDVLKQLPGVVDPGERGQYWRFEA